MAKISAGLLMYKVEEEKLQVFLVHPGGPFYAKKDEGCWSIPKGEVNGNNNYLEDAIREFEEETGNTPKEPYHSLGEIKQNSGKHIHIWAFEGDLTSPFQSNSFEMEWPPKSGKIAAFPEADRGEFFDIDTAKKKIISGQMEFLDRLQTLLNMG